MTGEEEAWTGPAQSQSSGKVHWHRACIVRHENASLIRREFEHLGIALTFKVSLGCSDEVERRFSLQYSDHNGSVPVSIGKKADVHGSGLLIACRASCNLGPRVQDSPR